MKITKETRLFLCKYVISDFIITNKEDRLEMNASNILKVEYVCDYDMSIFAILKVVLRVDVRKRIYLLKHKRDIRVKLQIDKLGIDINTEAPITNPEKLITGLFSVYFSDNDESADTSTLEKRLAENQVGSGSDKADINDENYLETQNTVELYLFEPDLLKSSRFSFNRIYTEGTLQNMVGQLLTMSKHKKVLMSKFENGTTYKELLVPPNPVFKCLLYLDQYFGFYKTGATIFYDIDTLYILNTNGKVTATRKDEWTETSFLIPEIEDAVPGNGMVRQPNEKIFYPSINEGDITHQKISTLQQAAKGNKVKIVLSDGTEVVTVSPDKEAETDHQNESVVYMKKENLYTETVLKARMLENDDMVYISADNLDIGAFTPNKTYRLIYDEPTKSKQYRGEYRLAYAYHTIMIESDIYSSASHHIVLKLTKSPA